MTGPSAMGSEKGTPSSMTSAPPATSACMSGTVRLGCGSPAVMNGMSALRRSRRSRSKVDAMRDTKGSGDSIEGARRPSELDPGFFSHGVHVLVAATGEVHEEYLIPGQTRR